MAQTYRRIVLRLMADSKLSVLPCSRFLARERVVSRDAFKCWLPKSGSDPDSLSPFTRSSVSLESNSPCNVPLNLNTKSHQARLPAPDPLHAPIIRHRKGLYTPPAALSGSKLYLGYSPTQHIRVLVCKTQVNVHGVKAFSCAP